MDVCGGGWSAIFLPRHIKIEIDMLSKKAENLSGEKALCRQIIDVMS